MTDILIDYLLNTWLLLNEAAPWVLFGFLVAGCIKALVPDDFIARHLGRDGAGSVLKASAMGVPIPLCSCGVVPAATGLRRQGASKGATAAFMISTPETGADSIAVTWALLDPVMTVLRPLAAFITATVAGLAINALPKEAAPPAAPAGLPMQDAGCGCGGSCGGGTERTGKPTLSHRLREGLAFSFGEMLKDIGSWLLLGILLAGLISTFVPDDFFLHYLGGEWGSLVVMLVAGVPLYICATSSTPIAATMALKGLSPGAALVFLLAGPATNAATIAVASRILGKRATVVYVASIAVCALALGWLVNRIYFGLGLDVASWVHGSDAEGATWFTALCSILLLALVARHWFRHGSHSHSDCGCGCETGHDTPHGGNNPPGHGPRISGNDFVVK